MRIVCNAHGVAIASNKYDMVVKLAAHFESSPAHNMYWGPSQTKELLDSTPKTAPKKKKKNKRKGRKKSNYG